MIKDLDELRKKKQSSPYTYFVMDTDTEPVFVYTDIVEPQLIGDSYVKCLRVIQFPSVTGHHIFTNIYYVPVEKRRLKP